MAEATNDIERATHLSFTRGKHNKTSARSWELFMAKLASREGRVPSPGIR